jgi:hypothetical protein
MHLDGVSQSGPTIVSHAAPSAAGATHVAAAPAPKHVAPAAHALPTPMIAPQACVAGTIGCITHVSVVESHVSPSVWLQFGPVLSV